jgi:hypothetical protein
LSRFDANSCGQSQTNLRISCEMKYTHTSQSEASLLALRSSALVVRPVLETAALLVFVSAEEKSGG